MEQSFRAQHSDDRKEDAPVRHPSGVGPDSRGSSVASVHAEPLTLYGDEIHDAKEAAEYAVTSSDPQTADQLLGLVHSDSANGVLGVGGRQTRKEMVESTEAAAIALSAKINELVEKAEQVVEANKISQEALVKIPGTAAAEAAKGGSKSESLTTSNSSQQQQQEFAPENHPHSD